MNGNLQKETVYSRYSELAGWMSVSVNAETWEKFGTNDVVNSESFGHFKSCKRDSILVTLTYLLTYIITYLFI